MSIAQHPEEILDRVEDLYLAGKISLTTYLVLARECHTAVEQRTEPLPVRIISTSNRP